MLRGVCPGGTWPKKKHHREAPESNNLCVHKGVVGGGASVFLKGVPAMKMDGGGLILEAEYDARVGGSGLWDNNPGMYALGGGRGDEIAADCAGQRREPQGPGAPWEPAASEDFRTNIKNGLRRRRENIAGAAKNGRFKLSEDSNLYITINLSSTYLRPTELPLWGECTPKTDPIINPCYMQIKELIARYFHLIQSEN